MDAITLLRRGHGAIIARLRDLTRPRARASALKHRTAAGVARAIEVQWRVEEDLFYPALRARADRSTRLRIVEAIEEHRTVGDVLRQIGERNADDASRQGRLLLLREHIEHHVETEEKLFSAARLLLGDELVELGERMQARSLELKRAGARARSAARARRCAHGPARGRRPRRTSGRVRPPLRLATTGEASEI